MNYNPEVERLYISRDLITEETEALRDGYLGTLRKLAGFHKSRDLHVSVLTQSHIGRILESYPNDDPYELFVDALCELRLDPLKYAHIKKPEVYEDRRRLNNAEAVRYFVVCPLDRIGVRRVRSDTRRILGHFGINGLVYQGLEPHMTLTYVDGDKKYADYLARKAGESMARSEPITLSFPVADYRIVSGSG